ncbi:M48 family metallopeptidase [Cellulomonas sp. URHD0024]|uniref:M48 family metallopeptidase n=1 Tax=Cellulomonas sp. URHD0024 TaxID=1302620 RepID=UPI0004051303|nr:M48 family metallopeptidase [Cellulomonas sp. URHD0024]
MTTTLRAAISVLMLAGFYVVAFGLLGLMVWGSVWAFHNGEGFNGFKLAAGSLFVSISIVVALWKVAHARPKAPTGPTLTESDAPALWATIHELAAVADTRVPDEIRLGPVVNAAVSEESRLLGLVGGRRTLYLGVPLVQALDVGQLRSVLAHELGHYSRSHTRLGPLAYRGRQAIGATVEQLDKNLVGIILKQYAKLYLIVGAAVNRRQELEADQLSVQVAGRATAQGALREIPLADAAWNFYLDHYVNAGWEDGYAPTAEAFFGGFGDMLVGRAGELESLRADAPPAEQSRWDSHPSIAARVAAMDRMPDPAPLRDTRPAKVLVQDFARHAAHVAQHVLKVEDRTQLEWSEVTSRSIIANRERRAAIVCRAAARVAVTPQGNLGTVLDVIESGQQVALSSVLGLDGPLDEPLRVVIDLALVTSGAALWEHSWSGAARLVDAAGRDVDVTSLVALAADPATVPAARTRLAELGVDLGAVVQIPETPTAPGAEVVGGIGSMKVDGSKLDVLVLDNGLILVPIPASGAGTGKDRMVNVLRSASVEQLITTHRFVPFDDLASAVVHKEIPVKLTLAFRDGSTMELQEPWTGETLSKDSAKQLIAHVRAYAPAVG